MAKEVCAACTKFVNIGQPILECEICFTAIHTKCHKTANYSPVNGRWCCQNCASIEPPRYNPFPTNMVNESSDKFYDDEGAYDDAIIQSISKVLDSCNCYSAKNFNQKVRLLGINIHNGHESKNPDIKCTQFSTYFHNIDGNKTNFNSLCVDLKRLNIEFSVVALAETNVDAALQNLYQIPNYDGFYQSIMDDKEKGTGVALYVNKNFNAEIIENLGYCNEHLESLFVSIWPPSDKSKKIIAGVIYRPPSGNATKFLQYFEKICSNLPSSGVRILGDFNIDFLQMKSNTNIPSQFEDFLLSNGLSPVISIPTHTRTNCNSTCIDNILTNNIEKTKVSGTISDSPGDHLPIFEISNIFFVDDRREDAFVKYYDYSNQNLNQFVVDLHDDLKNLKTADDFSCFTEIFQNALDRTCKLEHPKTTKRTYQYNPWITESIIDAVDTKHKLKDDWIKTIEKEKPKGDQTVRKIFTDYRRVLKHVINTAKNSYDCKRIQENKGDLKKTWKIINEIRGKTKATIKPSFIIDNQKITNRRVISNEFNKYFNSIASKLNDSLINQRLSDSHILSFEQYIGPKNDNSIFLEDCSEVEILKIISELDNNKASDLPIRVIKKAAHLIAPVLAQYFNLFMMEGVFPEILKIGRITPIFKKGNPEELGNYRPVSTLPIFGKIFEKIIYARIYNFALSQNIIDPNQFGFRQSHSTSHAINHSVKIIEDHLSAQKHVLGIFIDLSKAFDTIDHNTLVTKLNCYGIRGNAQNLIHSYLSSRTQYTEIFDEKSEKLEVKFGVPQGSVLGPLLFLLYINDISRSSNLGTFILFADDTNIFVAGQSETDAYEKANILLKGIQRYMYLNKLHINMSKCCYIHFKPKISVKNIPTDSNFEHQLLIDDFPIKKTSQTKFLGVIIDENLSWEPHITALRRKLNQAASTLHRIRDSIPEHLHKSLYHTLFESHLVYCISVWGGCSLYKIARLWILQKNCIRIIFGDKEAFLEKFRTSARARPYPNQLLGEEFYRKEHTKPLFKKHNILALRNLYTYHLTMEISKILKLRNPISIYSQIEISSRKESLIITSTPAQNFISRSSTLWNKIAPKFKINDYSFKLSLFKNTLKKSLMILQHSGDPLTWSSQDFDPMKLQANLPVST